MFGISFQAPEYIGAALFAVSLAAAFWWSGYRARKAARASYGEPRLIERYSRPLSASAELLYFSGYAIALVLLGMAASRPVMEGAPTNVRAGTVEVVVVTDVSRSMASEEYRPFMPERDGVPAARVAGAYGTRLDFVKHTIESRIIPALPGNRLGIVTYSGLGFTQAELTFDHSSLRWILRHWMPIGGAPGNGSDFASGLQEALQLFGADSGESSRQRVVVLFSDGGFTGNPNDLSRVISELARQQVRLVIVGVGAAEPSAIPQYSASGEMRGNLMRDGVPVLTRFEEDRLLALRAASNGEYIRAAPGDKLEIGWANVLGQHRVEMALSHLFAYPLGAALIILGLLQMRGIFRKLEAVKENP